MVKIPKNILCLIEYALRRIMSNVCIYVEKKLMLFLQKKWAHFEIFRLFNKNKYYLTLGSNSLFNVICDYESNREFFL